MSDFKEHCSIVAKEFIQTVLIIDDGASLGDKGESAAVVDAPGDPFALEEPTVDFDTNEEDSDEREMSHPLRTLELTNAFYDLGIVPGVYQPQIRDDEDELEFASKAVRVSASADIVILDWMLKEQQSQYSKAIVKKILEHDKESGGRLRSIIIYTGETDLSDLRDKLLVYLNFDEIQADGDYRISGKNLIIDFYGKDKQVQINRALTEEELPEKSIECFSELLDGLMPVFAVRSASEIRRNIGSLTSKFAKTVDAGYLTHRSLLPSPEDAELFMLEIFVTHLRSLLAISKADQECLGVKAIDKWISENQIILERDIEAGGGQFNFTKANLIEVLTDGYDSQRDDYGLKKVLASLNDKNNQNNKLSKGKVNKILKTDIHNAFSVYSKSGDALESIKELSVLSLFKRTRVDISKDYPYLTQGTVIYCIGTSKYYLCVTPKCDTVRLSGVHNFSFAPLVESDKGFDLVIRDLNLTGYITLSTQNKFFNLEHIGFAPLEGRVQCRDENGMLIFESSDSLRKKYRWIGDLEELQAQKRVINVVGDLSRNGVDEMEWLRQQ
ncbi:hypothetical protein ST37_14120 [Vibrio sp. qd031]|uniref:response regulator receiver domain n=1 Tax=Vibrio sp. qd031 TaxID=1603038 RepID=UPI000A10448C|nr:response regulator receiver domain [Vibrio sp. qd031]ORT49527.1 hypothetical protein ST37_14120 [Vibrio sp. qd031]